MRFAITGAAGLLGWHTAARIYAGQCAAHYRGQAPDDSLTCIDRRLFNDAQALAVALRGVDTVIHFAGVNRADEDQLLRENLDIAERLSAAIETAGSDIHVVNANSTHALGDTHYGHVKREAAKILADRTPRFSDVMLPHVFGERARPYYNNVTATLIDKLWRSESPSIDPSGQVQLIHAGDAAERMIAIARVGDTGCTTLPSRPTSVQALFDRLGAMHRCYTANTIPVFGDAFDKALFNSLRSAKLDHELPFSLKLNSDDRGILYETAKGGVRSQTFMSTTHPGITRGNHFHLHKIERFVVVGGEALIRMRKVLGDEIIEFPVSGQHPVAIDMPPLYTHSIENTGNTTLITQFWVDEIFDPNQPDTYADSVLREP